LTLCRENDKLRLYVRSVSIRPRRVVHLITIFKRISPVTTIILDLDDVKYYVHSIVHINRWIKKIRVTLLYYNVQ